MNPLVWILSVYDGPDKVCARLNLKARSALKTFQVGLEPHTLQVEQFFSTRNSFSATLFLTGVLPKVFSTSKGQRKQWTSNLSAYLQVPWCHWIKVLVIIKPFYQLHHSHPSQWLKRFPHLTCCHTLYRCCKHWTLQFCVHLQLRLDVYSFLWSGYSFIRSFDCSFVRLFVYSFLHSYI